MAQFIGVHTIRGSLVHVRRCIPAALGVLTGLVVGARDASAQSWCDDFHVEGFTVRQNYIPYVDRFSLVCYYWMRYGPNVSCPPWGPCDHYCEVSFNPDPPERTCTTGGTTQHVIDPRTINCGLLGCPWPASTPSETVTLHWPPLRGGIVGVNAACSGSNRGIDVSVSRPNPGNTPTYRVEGMIQTLGPVSQRLISFAIPPSYSTGTQTFFYPIPNLTSRTPVVVLIREYCGNDLLRDWTTTATLPGIGESCDQTCSSVVGASSTLCERGRERSRFKVRTPTAWMGTRGFVDYTIALRLPRLDPSWTVRWRRTLGDTPSEDGTLGIVTVNDGVQPGGSVVNGATGPELRIVNATAQDEGLYFMELLPPPGVEAEPYMVGTIRLLPENFAPSFSSEPLPRTLCPSQVAGEQGVSIPVAATASLPNLPVHYQWFVNGDLARNSDTVTVTQTDPAAPPFAATIRLRGCCTSGLELHDYTVTGTPPASVTFTVACEISDDRGATRSISVPITIDHGEFDCDADGVTNACEIAIGAPDLNDNDTPDDCECIADIDGDRLVAGSDLTILLASWGPVFPELDSMSSDIDADGMIGGSDLTILLNSWGKCN